jgi:hypothetical protein
MNGAIYLFKTRFLFDPVEPTSGIGRPRRGDGDAAALYGLNLTSPMILRSPNGLALTLTPLP